MPARGRVRKAAVAETSPGSARIAAPAERDGLTTWDLGDLPEVLDTRVAGGVVRGYPALVDQGRSVSLRVEATAEAALAATRGRRAAAGAAGHPPASYVQEQFRPARRSSRSPRPHPNVAALVEDARTAVARAAIERLTRRTGIVRSEAEFARARRRSRDHRRRALRRRLAGRKILTTPRAVERARKGQNSLALLGPLNDIRGQLAELTPGFISAWVWSA